MDTYEVGEKFEVAAETGAEIGEKFEVAAETEAEIGEKFEVAAETEAEIGPPADGGSSRPIYKTIKLFFLIGSMFLAGAALWGVTLGIKQDIPLPPLAIASGSGSSYTAALPASSYWLFESLADSPINPGHSQTELFENDKPLGPAHSAHNAISGTGSGQFSHWGSTLYFSTSDNSEPRINGRHYKAVITTTLPLWVLAIMAPCLLLSLYLNRQLVSLPLLQPVAGFRWLTQSIGSQARTVGAFLFLLAQFALLYYSGYSSLSSLLAFGILFLAFSCCLKFGAERMAWLFLSMFLASWFCSKYLVALHFSSSIGNFFQNWIKLKLSLVGISYIGFKLVHFVVDYRAKLIKNFSVKEFLSWLFFFPSVVAGPMQRFQDWQEQRATNRVTLEFIVEGVKRVVIGLVLKMVIADSIHSSTLSSMSRGTVSTASFFDIFLSAMAYTVYLYFDFSGYSSIAIGLGHFFGIKLPENFNAPYKARNLAEFWNRWHISLSELLRDYLYYPITISLKRRDYFKLHPRLGAAIPPILTFLIAGIWHGATLGFVIFGFLHGLGLAYLAVSARKKKSNRPLAIWWRRSRVAYVCSVAINFIYVSFTFIFFCLSNEHLKTLWLHIFNLAPS